MEKEREKNGRKKERNMYREIDVRKEMEKD